MSEQTDLTIASTDFRPGNYIIDNTGQYTKLGTVHDPCRYRPIAISLDKLQGMWFRWDSIKLWHYNLPYGYLQYSSYNNTIQHIIMTEIGEKTDSHELKYIHQVQNYVYALTNQELPVTL